MIQAAAGFPQQSGILIPEIWSGKTLVKFYEESIMGQLCNTDYEGEIKTEGDTVWIRTIPDMQIRNYEKGQTLAIQRPQPTKIALTIDRAKYWNAQVDDIDKLQSDLNFMEDWSQDAAQQMKQEWDTEFLADVYADAHARNKGAQAGVRSRSINLGSAGSPIVVTKTNVLDVLVDIGVVLDEQRVPRSERRIAIPPWFAACIKLSDLRDASLTGDGKSTLRSGRIGEIDNLELFTSNLISTVTDTGNQCYNVLATHKSGITFASQLIKNEVIRAESTFGHLARGLQVCGWQGIKSESIVHLYCRKG